MQATSTSDESMRRHRDCGGDGVRAPAVEAVEIVANRGRLLSLETLGFRCEEACPI